MIYQRTIRMTIMWGPHILIVYLASKGYDSLTLHCSKIGFPKLFPEGFCKGPRAVRVTYRETSLYKQKMYVVL